MMRSEIPSPMPCFPASPEPYLKALRRRNPRASRGKIHQQQVAKAIVCQVRTADWTNVEFHGGF